MKHAGRGTGSRLALGLKPPPPFSRGVDHAWKMRAGHRPMGRKREGQTRGPRSTALPAEACHHSTAQRRSRPVGQAGLAQTQENVPAKGQCLTRRPEPQQLSTQEGGTCLWGERTGSHSGRPPNKSPTTLLAALASSASQEPAPLPGRGLGKALQTPHTSEARSKASMLQNPSCGSPSSLRLLRNLHVQYGEPSIHSALMSHRMLTAI